MVQVSIGLPFFNNESTLKAAIQSVFAQTFRDWELILVDDGSTDGSLGIARSVSDPRMRIVSDGRNRGIGARLNEISTLARGPFLARMDADDMMHPERLARQVRFLEADPAVDVVGTGFFSIDAKDQVIGVRGDKPLQLTPEGVLRSGVLGHPTVMGRRGWFLANRYDERFLRAQDRELWCRTVGHATMANIPAPLFFYREGRVTLGKYLESQRAGRMILARYGPVLVGGRRTRVLLLASHVRTWIYRFGCRLGLDRRLVRRRSRRLSLSEVVDAARSLQTIYGTAVPGLTSWT